MISAYYQCGKMKIISKHTLPKQRVLNWNRAK